MKKLIALVIMLYVCSFASAQFGVSYHLSHNFSKIGLSYDFNQKWRANIGLYNDSYFDYNYPPTLDAAVTYNLINREKYDMYIGIGGILNKMQMISNGILFERMFGRSLPFTDDDGTTYSYDKEVGFYLYNGLTVPAGVSIKPFKSLTGFSMLIEATPVLGFHYEGMHLYCSAGVRYVFGKKE